MKNKIGEIIYFICFTILFSEVSSFGQTSTQRIKTGITAKKEVTTLSIEDFAKTKIPKNKGILYTIVPRGLVISVPTVLLFNDGKDDIKENAKPLLKEFGQIIQELGISCVVEGNALTQQENDELSNLELSIMRAEIIVEFLLKTTKIDPLKIRAIGFGEMLPFNDNVSYKGNLDKRIDFVILNYMQGR